jgi:spore maturation protein CgeB
MEWHVLDALRNLGHEAAIVDTNVVGTNWGRISKALASRTIDIFVREPERRADRKLLRKIEEFSPTLILVILGSQLSPKTVLRLRKATKAPIVCWCQDQMTTLGRQYLLGAGYDAIFLKDRYMQDLFSRMITSTSFHYLPEACNPRVHRRLELTADDMLRFGCDVGIACTLYYYRQEILQQLREFDLKLWGTVPDWLLYRLRERPKGREIFMDDKARAARGARICLNTLHFAEVDGLNSRAFELAGCGGFQILTSRPVLREHFLPGIEVESFESIGELIEKIRHYLRHPDSAASIAERGQKRAHAAHTYEHRLQEIFRIAMN